jgi:1-phosphatidylinositol-3-phosphate 5-kinase
MCQSEADEASRAKDSVGHDIGNLGSVSENLNELNFHSYTGTMVDYNVENVFSDPDCDNLTSNLTLESDYLHNESEGDSMSRDPSRVDLQETMLHEEGECEAFNSTKDKINEDEFSGEYFSATEAHQSILVYFSSHCVSKGTVCERTRLLRIKFYGSFDKPLGRYLHDDLFDQVSRVYFSLFAVSLLIVNLELI